LRSFRWLLSHINHLWRTKHEKLGTTTHTGMPACLLSTPITPYQSNNTYSYCWPRQAEFPDFWLGKEDHLFFFFQSTLTGALVSLQSSCLCGNCCSSLFLIEVPWKGGSHPPKS
jgi:hypothetical protein